MKRLALITLLLVAAACSGPQRSATVGESRPETISGDAYHHFIMAELLADSDDYAGAVDEMRLALAADPDAPLVAMRLAEFLVAGGDLDAAIDTAHLAESLGSPRDETIALEAYALGLGGDLDAALTLLETSVDLDFGEPFFVTWHTLAWQHDDPARSIEATTNWVDAHPLSIEAWNALGEAYYVADDLDLAVDAYEQVYMLSGGDPDGAEMVARIELSRDNLDAAHAALVVCTERYSEHVGCYQLLVYVRDLLAGSPAELDDDTQLAVEMLASRVIIDSRRISRVRSWLVRNQIRTPIVLALAYTIADLRPYNAESLQTAAWLAYDAGEIEASIELMDRVLTVDRMNVSALNYIGYMWADLNTNLDQAEVYIQDALTIRPDDPNIMDSLAWVYFRQGRLEEAASVQEDAVSRDGGQTLVLLDHLGDIYMALERYEDAIDAWERALIVADPEDPAMDAIPAKLQQARDALGGV